MYSSSCRVNLPFNRTKPVKACHRPTQTCKLILMSAELILKINPFAKTTSAANLGTRQNVSNWALQLLTHSLIYLEIVYCFVAVPPRIKYYTRPTDIKVRVGDDVILMCNSTGIPPPTITWYRLNKYNNNLKESKYKIISNIQTCCDQNCGMKQRLWSR